MTQPSLLLNPETQRRSHVVPWETPVPTSMTESTSQLPQISDRRASLFSWKARRQSLTPSRKRSSSLPSATTPDGANESNEVITPVEQATTAVNSGANHRRGSVDVVLEIITTKVRTVKRKVFKRSQSHAETSNHHTIQSTLQNEIQHIRYSLDLPPEVSRDKSELDYLRRKNMEAMMGLPPGTPDTQDDSDVEFATETLITEETTWSVANRNGFVETSTSTTEYEHVEYAGPQPFAGVENERPQLKGAPLSRVATRTSIQASVIVTRPSEIPDEPCSPVGRKDSGYDEPQPKVGSITRTKEALKQQLSLYSAKTPDPREDEEEALPTKLASASISIPTILPSANLPPTLLTPPERPPPRRLSREEHQQARRKSQAKLFVRLSHSPTNRDKWHFQPGDFSEVQEEQTAALDKALNKVLQHAQCGDSSGHGYCGKECDYRSRSDEKRIRLRERKLRESEDEKWYVTIEEALVEAKRVTPLD